VAPASSAAKRKLTSQSALGARARTAGDDEQAGGEQQSAVRTGVRGDGRRPIILRQA